MVETGLLKDSSIYAVSKVGQAQSVYLKGWWLFVLIFGLFGSGWKIINFLSFFIQYPVAVDLTIDNKLNTDFPAVTICNLNRMRRQYINCMNQNLSFDNCRGSSGSSAGRSSLIISERRSVSSCSNHLSGILDKNTQDRLSFLMSYTKLNSTDREQAGHELKELISHCTFNGKQCTDDFDYFQNYRFGNCFTMTKNKLFSAAPSPFANRMNELEITLNIETYRYLDVTPSLGARVIIHNPKDDPSPEENGINVSPGFETSIEIMQESFKRLPAPYRDRCINYGSDETARGKSRNDCVRICTQEQNFAHCKCLDPTLPSIENLKLCNMTNSTQACCLDNLLESMSVHGLPCKCPLPCFTTKYRTQISTAALHEFDQTEENYAIVKIYHSRLRNAIFYQKPMFDNSELFGSLGGQFSLWLGLSLFAIFELFQYVTYLCLRICQKRSMKHKCRI